MGLRHKAFKETLDKGYASEWNDDHIHDFTDEISHDLLFLGAAVSVNWDTAQTSGGSAPVWAITSGHAAVVLNTGATTNNVSSMRQKLSGAVGNITHPDDLPVLTLALGIIAVYDAALVANSVVEFGFQHDDDALFTQNQHFAIFRVYNGLLHAVTGDGAAETETELAAYEEYSTYRIEILSTSVKFYVDDMVTAVATHTTHLPNADLTIKVSVRSKNNVDSTLRLDALALARLRKA